MFCGENSDGFQIVYILVKIQPNSDGMTIMYIFGEILSQNCDGMPAVYIVVKNSAEILIECQW